MIRKLLIKLLFTLLRQENPRYYQDIDGKRIDQWQDLQFSSVGFWDYHRRRMLTIMETISNGLSRDEYMIQVGQKLERMLEAEQVRMTHERMDKIRKQQFKEEQKKVEEQKK
jgi:hypothetical protein